MSVVSNGHLAGSTLHDVVVAFGSALFGAHPVPDRFPLLVKILDAKQTLSVQVHPPAGLHLLPGAEPKSEMWHVLDAPHGSCVFAGLAPGTTRAGFLKLLERGTIEPLLRRIEVKTGDTVYVPGGRIHAVGSGCLLLEVQQNSNTTYRVFDWNRLGADGKPRPLHRKEALETIAWDDFADPRPARADLPSRSSNRQERLIHADAFDVRRINLVQAEPGTGDGTTFDILFVIAGTARIATSSSEPVDVHAGAACLVPAILQPYALLPAATGTVVIRIQPGTL